MSSLSNIPSGVQYIFDEEVRVRRWIERELMSVFEGWSYSEIILPIFDYADLFSLGMGKKQAEVTYRFTGRDGKLLALRPEMTSLVARTVATRFVKKPRPLRLCYSGEVFRWDQPRAGRQYEFHQIGLEHIGSERLEADTEALVVAIEALRRIGLEAFTITLSHVDFFNGIADQLELAGEARHLLREIIDRKEVDRLDAFIDQHAGAPGENARAALSRLATLTGKRDVISQARALASNKKSIAALDDLARVIDIAEALSIDRYIDVDLGEVGELDYYTGLTFKVYAAGLGTALGRGGRYDELLAKFGKPESAVGFSLCLDWLPQLLSPESRGSASGSNEVTRLKTDGDIVGAFKRANKLRTDGKRVEIE